VAEGARLDVVNPGIPHVSIAADNASQVMTRNAASQLLRQPGYCCGKHHAITVRTVILVSLLLITCWPCQCGMTSGTEFSGHSTFGLSTTFILVSFSVAVGSGGPTLAAQKGVHTVYFGTGKVTRHWVEISP
jgi:hypothetical protein